MFFSFHFISWTFSTPPDSSFANSVRYRFNILHSSRLISNCEITGGKCNPQSHNDLPAGKSYTIESCSFTQLSAYKGNGSSIYIYGNSGNKESTSLTINKCTFTSCSLIKVLSYPAGGAIYCYMIKSVEIKETLFSSCGDLTHVYRGGAVDIESVSSPLVKECSFIFCTSKMDAGGLGVFGCGNSNSFCVQDSVFVYCDCPDSSGAFEFHTTNSTMCSSCLYSKCTSIKGGASWVYFHRTYSSNEISFSLYHGNGNERGKDLFFSDATSTVISHSFTTSSGTGRVYREKGTTNADAWLPQANMNVKVITEDSIQANNRRIFFHFFKFFLQQVSEKTNQHSLLSK